jgi:DNA-binding CsgD family transcriptional regulator/tetratricopeptide (TPR) repeat protein
MSSQGQVCAPERELSDLAAGVIPDALYSGDSRVLRRLLRDVTAATALPALWSGREPGYIVGGLLDVLTSLLHLDCAYARFDDPAGGPAIEDWRPQGPHQPEQLAQLAAASPFNASEATSGLPHPSGSTMTCTRIWTEFPGERGVVVAGACRAEFPSELETFLLRVVVNQATVALHGAHLLLYSRPADAVRRSPFVGREREQQVLRQQLTAALAGHGRLVLVGGEAGIGKTALADDLGRVAAEQGALVMTGHCYALQDTPPYGPWREIAQHFHELQQQIPALEGFPMPSLATSVSQAHLFDQIRAFLTAATAERPLVLVLEDMHWADPASLDLLRFLAHGLASLSLLILVTYRADELTRQQPLYTLLPFLVREAQAERIDLHPLSYADVHALVTRRYRLTEADARHLAAHLHARAEGNPLFLNELRRTLEEQHLLKQAWDGTWQVGDIDQVPVPAFLQQVIDARLARLGDAVDVFLDAAAVIGQEVPLAVWSATLRVEEDALLPLLERAVAANVVQAWENGEGVRFTHALIHQALYERIPAWQRRRLHGTVAEALLASAHPNPDAVAHHLQHAGDPRAAQWLIAAGEQAERAFAFASAIERYEAASDMLDVMGAANERGWLRLRLAVLCLYRDPGRAMAYLDAALPLADAADDRQLAARIVALQGVLHAFTGAVRQGLAELAAGVAASEALPEPDPSYRSVVERMAGHTERGALVSLLAHSGHLADAREQGERYVADAATSLSAPLPREALGAAHDGLGFVYAMQGEVAFAQRAFASAAALFQRHADPLRRLFTLRDNLALVLLPYRADEPAERARVAAAAELAGWEVFSASGHGDAADLARYPLLPLMVLEGHWQDAQRVAAAFDDFIVLDMPAVQYRSAVCGSLARAQGETERAWRFVRDALPDGPSTEPGDLFSTFVPPVQRLAAALALDAGDLGTAREWLAAHDGWLDWMDAVLGRADGQLLWAGVERAAGNRRAAIDHVQSALIHARSPYQPLALLAAQRLRGTLDRDAARYDEAEQHFAASLALADACAAPYERALTLLAVAELRLAIHDRDGAEQALAEVRAICAPLDATPALVQASALAATLDAAADERPKYPAGLSEREVEVLRLLATGSTNPEIAERLFISPYTVKRHVSNILTKLNVTTRAAAARFAVEHELT